ncbi:hypothetical protein BX666DRAFT_2111922 [Dichotomocladium elegans]|nr:hypothetical protein BX666DRAFT_2111922 [Dichotomocladium elegans]
MVMRFLVYMAVFLATILTASATHFVTPTLFTQWETGSRVKVRIKGGYSKSGSIQLVEMGGFVPKNMGYLVHDFELKGDQTFLFTVWQELPPGATYQLAFTPRVASGNATAAYSFPFTIKHPAVHVK